MPQGSRARAGVASARGGSCELGVGLFQSLADLGPSGWPPRLVARLALASTALQPKGRRAEFGAVLGADLMGRPLSGRRAGRAVSGASEARSRSDRTSLIWGGGCECEGFGGCAGGW